MCAGQKSRPPRSSQRQPSLFSAIQRIKIASRWSEKPVSQCRSNDIVSPHNRQSTLDTAEAEAVAISAWQLEQRRIAASHEIVVTTTTRTLRCADRRRNKFHLRDTPYRPRSFGVADVAAVAAVAATARLRFRCWSRSSSVGMPMPGSAQIVSSSVPNDPFPTPVFAPRRADPRTCLVTAAFLNRRA